MKKFSLIIGALAVLAFVATPAFAGTKNATGSTAATIVFGPESKAPQLTSVDATSDKVGSKVTVSTEVANGPYTVNGAGSASQAVIPLTATTGLASNDMVVVAGPKNRLGVIAAYKGTVITVTTSNVTLSGNLTTAVTNNYRVHRMGTAYTIAVGSNSVSKSGTPIANGGNESPMVLILDGTSACELSATTQ